MQIKADLGFLGIKKLYPKAKVPHKSSKKKPLTKAQKAENRLLSKERIIVENVIQDCKVFRICCYRYRGKGKNMIKTWRLVAGLVNMKRVMDNQKHADTFN